jgi:hypothetical protein
MRKHKLYENLYQGRTNEQMESLYKTTGYVFITAIVVMVLSILFFT